MSALVLPIRKSSQSMHTHFWKTQLCSKQSWCCLLALHVKLFWKKLIALCSEYVNWRGSVMKVPKLIALLILVFSVNNTAYSWCNAALFFTVLLYCNLVQWGWSRYLNVNCSKSVGPHWPKWICKNISEHSNQPETKKQEGVSLLEHYKTFL